MSGTDPATFAVYSKDRSTYAFVNNVRFVSMMAIVGMHSAIVPTDWDGPTLVVALVQAAKFSTVCFFLISGFLLGDHLDRVAPGAYFARRVRTVAAPWGVWASAYLVVRVALDRFAHHGTAAHSLGYHLSTTLFVSPYWFVLNLLGSLAFLLALRRWIYRPWLGALLGCATLAYGVNLHVGWWDNTRHTTAWGGFTLFIWFGIQLQRRLASARALVARTPWPLLGAVVLSTYALALGESWLLFQRRGAAVMALSTLRVGNLAYSLAVFALLFKSTRALNPRAMDVRRHTFGIYLAHTLVFAFVGKLFVGVGALAIGVHPSTFNSGLDGYIVGAAPRMLVWLGVFVVVYSASWWLAARFAASSLGALVGVRRGEGGMLFDAHAADEPRFARRDP